MAQPGRLLTADLAPRPDFATAERLHAVIAALAPDHLQPAGFEVHLSPLQRYKLADAQAVPISHQDHRRIPVPVPPPLPRCIA